MGEAQKNKVLKVLLSTWCNNGNVGDRQSVHPTVRGAVDHALTKFGEPAKLGEDRKYILEMMEGGLNRGDSASCDIMQATGSLSLGDIRVSVIESFE